MLGNLTFIIPFVADDSHNSPSLSISMSKKTFCGMSYFMKEGSVVWFVSCAMAGLKSCMTFVVRSYLIILPLRSSMNSPSGPASQNFMASMMKLSSGVGKVLHVLVKESNIVIPLFAPYSHIVPYLSAYEVSALQLMFAKGLYTCCVFVFADDAYTEYMLCSVVKNICLP